jgi:hypothetical protein
MQMHEASIAEDAALVAGAGAVRIIAVCVRDHCVRTNLPSTRPTRDRFSPAASFPPPHSAAPATRHARPWPRHGHMTASGGSWRNPSLPSSQGRQGDGALEPSSSCWRAAKNSADSAPLRPCFARLDKRLAAPPQRPAYASLIRQDPDRPRRNKIFPRANRWFHQHRERRQPLHLVYRGADRFAGRPIAMMARTTATLFASPPGKLAQGAVRLQQWRRSNGAEASRRAEKHRNRSKLKRLR